MENKKMKVQDIHWENYNNDSIDFILNESEKFINETFKSFREITNKCYYALGIYIAVLSYCVNRIIDNETCKSNIPFIIMVLGLFICIIILFKTLMPGNLVFPGTKPESLLIDYFEKIPKDEQLLEYKIQTIVANENGLSSNRLNITNRISTFKTSIYVFLAFILIAFFSYFIFI